MRSCAKLYPPHSPCHEIFFPLPPRHDRRIDNPLSFIPRRTNGHWLLACSRVCHRENRVPSNRELALFFLHAVCWPTQCAVETAHDARWRCANESPQIGPFFRPMSGVVRRLERTRLFSLAAVFGILRGNYGFANDRSFSLSLSIYSASICRGISSLL